MPMRKRGNSAQDRARCRLITVVLLSYRSEHLTDALASVLEQTYPRIQLILADDGTERFDAAGVEQFVLRNQRGNIESFRLLHAAVNTGTVANYNRALRVAEGDYIYPLAADDVYMNRNTLKRWTAYFMKHDVPVMCAYCTNYDETLRRAQGRWPRPDHARLIMSGAPREIYRAMEVQKLLPGCTMARTRRSLETLGYFDESYRLLEDYPFMMRILREGAPVGFWPHSAVKRRCGGVSDSRAPHPQLVADMERFYEQELFLHSEDPVGLRAALRSIEERRQAALAIAQQWNEGNFRKRVCIGLKHPRWLLGRLYHWLIKT